MPSGKQLKLKIKSITSVKKITEAMRNSASTALMKYRGEVAPILEYILQVGKLADKLNWNDYYLQNKKSDKLFIFIGSDKGLCGLFNHNIVKGFYSTYKGEGDLLFIGKRMYEILKFANPDLEGTVMSNKGKPTMEYISQIYNIAKKYRHCDIIYNKCYSIVNQKQEVRSVDTVTSKNCVKTLQYDPSYKEFMCTFEYQFKTSMIHYCLVESHMSFLSSKVISMENASKNAKDIVDETKKKYNRLRQHSITKELIEIISAKQVLLNE